MRARGHTAKQAELVEGRVGLVIEQAAFAEYAEVDAVRVVKAIKDLQDRGQFKTTATANKYLEAFAWTRWMLMNDRWDRDPLATACKSRGTRATPAHARSYPRRRSPDYFVPRERNQAAATSPANSGTGSI